MFQNLFSWNPWSTVLDHSFRPAVAGERGPMVTIITIAIVTFVISAVIYAVYASDRWSAVRIVLREPVGSGEFAYTGDAPNAVFNGREYTTTFFKDLHTDPKNGYRYAFHFVHDENDTRTIEFNPEDIESSGLTPIQYIKKEVYQL